MSLQIPIPISSPSAPRPQPHPPLLNTYDTIIPTFSIESLSLAIAASIRASKLNLNILFFLPSDIASENILAQDIGGSILEDFATGMDPTSRFTYLNYLAEEGKLLEWMSLGEEGMRPGRNEWEGYVRWCAETVVKESEAGIGGGVQFLRGEAEGMRERGNGRGVDVFVRLNGGEEVMVKGGRVMCAEQEEVNGMMGVLEGMKRACERVGQSELNLATMARENDELLSKWEEEEERRMLRAVL